MKRRSMARFCLIWLAFSIPLAVEATIPTELWCDAGICVSINKHPEDPVLDGYIYRRADERQFVIRFQSGAMIIVWLSRTEAAPCERSFTRLVGTKDNNTTAIGCLVQNDRRIGYNIHVTSVGTSALKSEVVLNRASPVGWLSGVDEGGNFHRVYSKIVFLDGSQVR